jgi:Ser/Thr protein kinase RdoA (MazF antagonist)
LSYSEYGRRYYALYDFIKGYCCSDYLILPKIRQRMIANAAAKLAEFHQLISDFVPRGRKFNGFTPDGVRLWRDCSWHLKILDQYLEKCNQKTSQNDKELYLQDIAAEFKKLFIESDRYYHKPDPQFPKLVIHGDYQPRNVLFNHRSISGVLDFGDANLNLRITDVVRGLKTFCKDRIHFINEKQAQAFLHAYQDRIALSEKELFAIPDLMLRRNLRNIIWSLHGDLNHHENRRTPKYRFMKLRIKWEEALWIKRNKAELQDLFFSVSIR